MSTAKKIFPAMMLVKLSTPLMEWRDSRERGMPLEKRISCGVDDEYERVF